MYRSYEPDADRQLADDWFLPDDDDLCPDPACEARRNSEACIQGCVCGQCPQHVQKEVA